MDYHRRSIRLRKYDYASSGMYFVTICTQNREELLGKIVDGKVILNNIGNVIDDFWKILSLKYDGFDVNTWVIMPNHIHVIIKIVGANPCVRPIDANENTGSTRGSTRTLTSGMMTQRSTRTLGTMVKKFKTFITRKYIGLVRNKENDGFDTRLFQRNYYERIIRNEKELEKIRNYIVTNPQRWKRDRNNPKNITNYFN